MVGELDVLNEWIPEQMQPGTVFVLENAGEIGEKEDPYWAVLACPSCGMLGLITRKQINGFIPVICGSSAVPLSSLFATQKSWFVNRSKSTSSLAGLRFNGELRQIQLTNCVKTERSMFPPLTTQTIFPVPHFPLSPAATAQAPAPSLMT